MSLRKLPEIKAFLKPQAADGRGVEPLLPDSTLARWKPGIHAAAADGSDVISIYDVIGADWLSEGVTSKRVAGALRSVGAKDVTVNLNSPGGDFFEGIAIYSLLKEHPHKVTVKIMGLAASAASVIAMAGDEIQISDAGFMMIHNAWCLAVGNRHDMIEAAGVLEPFDQAMAELYAKRAGVDVKDAAAWMDKESWFGAKAAIDAGLATGYLPSTEVTETDSKDARALGAARRIEAALVRANPQSSRQERRAVLQDLKGDDMPSAVDSQSRGGKPSAVATAKPSAGAEPGLYALLQAIRPSAA